MSTLVKIMSSLASPLGIIWLLLGIWVANSLRKKQLRCDWMPALAWLLLTLLTCTPLASWLLSSLENQTPKVAWQDIPQADALICLGGGAEPSLAEPLGFHLKTGADRLGVAVSLVAAGKAPLLILGGGAFKRQGKQMAEADALADSLKQRLHLPAEVLSLGGCSNTHDEALKVAVVMKQRGLGRLLLVTSAYHMPRSVDVFAKCGVTVVPVPCNYLSSYNRLDDDSGFHLLHLPDYHAFEFWAVWAHEILGQLAYRWKGWL